jgi:hypothetical protein
MRYLSYHFSVGREVHSLLEMKSSEVFLKEKASLHK